MDRAEQLWHQCELLLNIEQGTLLWQSPNFQFRRVYGTARSIYKVVDLKYDASGVFRAQNLAGEFSILKHCVGITGIPLPIAHHKADGFEVLVMERLPGELLSNLTVGWFRLIRILSKLAIILLRLSWCGISHNDIKPDNILITNDNSVSLVDFDQASRATFLQAFASQFLGISIGGITMYHSLTSVVKDHLRRSLPPKVVDVLRRLKQRRESKILRTLPDLPPDASSQLRTLREAWRLAQISNANAPGSGLAYYTLTLEGYCFHGERPWIPRWNMLRSATDYSGKRILELGCNMGLLSTFLLKECDAKAALGVDVDARILDAAKLISTAFNVKLDLKVIDCDDAGDWDTTLIDFSPDIVFALNVLNWVKDKKRLLNFLGRFQEVIFEGHDNFAIESKRLNGIGFKEIDVVGVSERGREVIRCRK